VASEELIELVRESLPDDCTSRNMEVLEFELNGLSYAFCEVKTDEIVSDGKYENGGNTYQLLEFDKTIISYPCTKSITNTYDLLVYVGFSRTGSYYTDWYYEYDKPELQRVKVATVPEEVIPEHDEVCVEFL